MGWVILYIMVKIGIIFILLFNYEKKCDMVVYFDKFIFYVWFFYDIKYEKWIFLILELMLNYFMVFFWNCEINDFGIIEF